MKKLPKLIFSKLFDSTEDKSGTDNQVKQECHHETQIPKTSSQAEFSRPLDLEFVLPQLIRDMTGSVIAKKELLINRSHMKTNEKIGPWVNFRGIELIFLNSGSAHLNGRLMRTGTVVRVNAGEIVHIEATEPTELVFCSYRCPKALSHKPLQQITSQEANLTPNDKKVSIIIAAKNIENYIGHCLFSCISQTHFNLQIIVVDDGSTDQTREKVEDAMKFDPRIELHRTLTGANGARKHGLKSAKGDFCLLIDGDDWLVSDAIERLLEVARDAESECVVFGFDHYNDKTGEIYDPQFPTVNQAERMPMLYAKNARSALETSHFNHTVWIYFFDSKLKSQATDALIDITYYEDLSFYINLVQYAEKPMICNRVLYHYRRNRAGQATDNWGNIMPAQKRASLNVAARHALGLFGSEKWFYQLVLLYKLRTIVNYEKRLCKEAGDETAVTGWDIEWRKLARLFPYELTDKIFEDHVRADVLGALSSRI